MDCETVKKWLVKNSAESENMNWRATLSFRVAPPAHVCFPLRSTTPA